MSEEALTKEEISHLKSLIKSEEAEAIAEARKLLDTRNTNADDLKKLFSKAAIYKLLSTWDPSIWDNVCELLSQHDETIVSLKEQIDKRVNSKSQNYDAQVELEENLSHLCEHCDGKALELLAELRTDENWVSSLTNSDSHIALAKSLVLSRNNDPEYNGLGLDGITELHEEPARELIKLEGVLRFKCLDELSDEVAEILSNHKHGIEFELPVHEGGLKTLSDKAAESFSKHQGQLKFRALNEISEKGAEYLSKHPNLILDGYPDEQLEIKELIISKRGPLTKEIVERFLEDDQSVRLDGYATISDDAVDALMGYSGHSIDLEGLKELSDESMEKLSNLKCWLSFNGFTELNDNQAESLSKYGHNVPHFPILTMWSLKSISDTAAQSLSKAKAQLNLPDEIKEKVNQYRES